MDAINLYNNISEAIGSKDTIKDVLENKRLDILNTHIGVYELKETSNDNMWDKEITFKIIAGELSINATKKSPIATLLARNSKVFYSSQSELLVIFNRPDTSQVYINRIYGNSFAIYERKATE